MPDSVIARMVNCETAAQVWHTIKVYFASQIRAKKSQFKTQLQNTCKDSLSVNEYLLRIRHFVNMLALLGYEISTKDHIDAIFNGLPPEYDILEISVNSSFTDYSVEEVESLILAQEVRIERAVKLSDSFNPSPGPSLASLAMTSGRPNSNPQFSSPNSGHFPHGSNSVFPGYSSGGFPSRPGHFSGNHNNKGRGRFGSHGRGQSWNNNKIQCQLCGKQGHMIVQCYYKFDRSFTGLSQFNHSVQGNLAQCPNQNSATNSAQMGALLATPEAILDLAWYTDESSDMEWYPNS